MPNQNGPAFSFKSVFLLAIAGQRPEKYLKVRRFAQARVQSVPNKSETHLAMHAGDWQPGAAPHFQVHLHTPVSVVFPVYAFKGVV